MGYYPVAILLFTVQSIAAFVQCRGGYRTDYQHLTQKTESRRDTLQKVSSFVGTSFFLFNFPATAASPSLKNRVEEIGSSVSGASFRGWEEPEITSEAAFDFSIDGSPAGRIKIALYGNVVPKTVSNFESLVRGTKYSYKGSEVYRIIKDLNIQLGNIGDVANKGLVGTAADGKPFPPENFDVTHKIDGIVSMVKDMKGMNDSRFFINLNSDAGWADGRYVAFGRVVEGMDLVKKMNEMKVSGPSNRPARSIIIDNCEMIGNAK